LPKLVNFALIPITTMLKLVNKILLIPYTLSFDMTEGYCVKCRTKREMTGAKAVTLKNGKPATKGSCPTCSTTMFRIGKG